MNVLYLGDIMAEPGVKLVEDQLTLLRNELNIDLVIAQAENVSTKGMEVAQMRRLQKAGVDFFTGGNHTPFISELHPLLKEENEPVIGPANMDECPGVGYKYLENNEGKVLVVSLLGATVGREVKSANPLKAIDTILHTHANDERIATIVNFHGDYSSEKVIIGHYLDGRVTAVIGDHWHVPTADAQVLPKGTAHITDVGMTGSLDSSLGISFDSVVPRWRDSIQTKNELELGGRLQLNGLLIDINAANGRANNCQLIRRIYE